MVTCILIYQLGWYAILTMLFSGITGTWMSAFASPTNHTILKVKADTDVDGNI